MRKVTRKVRRVLDSPGQLSQCEQDLAAVRRELKATKRKLKTSRNELKSTMGRGTPSITPINSTVPPAVKATITQARKERLTFLRERNLGHLASVVGGLDKASIPGMIIEAGTARGGSAIVLAAAKSPNRILRVYDVFGMIPEPSEKDGQDVHARYRVIASGNASGVDGETYYSYRDDLYVEVKDSFARLGVPVEKNDVHLIKGLFQNTIDIDGPVAFAHLDGDWYESTMTCLERIAPNLSPGGRIVLDDYYGWSGCRDAVTEYFSKHGGFHFEQHEKVHVVRH